MLACGRKEGEEGGKTGQTMRSRRTPGTFKRIPACQCFLEQGNRPGLLCCLHEPRCQYFFPGIPQHRYPRAFPPNGIAQLHVEVIKSDALLWRTNGEDNEANYIPYTRHRLSNPSQSPINLVWYMSSLALPICMCFLTRPFHHLTRIRLFVEGYYQQTRSSPCPSQAHSFCGFSFRTRACPG
jgi:hypothetical protein